MARFRLGDTWCSWETDKEAYIEALCALHGRVPDLFARLREQMRTDERTFFARVPEDLFLKSPHLVNNQANYHRIVPGWFADTNLADRSKERILIQACAIAGVSYTDDFEIEFDPGHHKALSKADMDKVWADLDAL